LAVHRQGGFTLLEMIVVLVVLSLLAGLVVARGPQRSAALDLRAAAAEMVQALRGARAQAIATNRRTVFRLDLAAHRYAVDGAAPRALPAALGLDMVFAAGQPGEAGAISFAPDGSSSGGRIDLSQGGRVVEVDIAWLTGRVTAQEAPRAPP
jgi:general secretion pathway protein H